MLKHLTVCLALAAGGSYAGTTAPVVETTNTTSVIPIKYAQRVLIFNHDKHGLTRDGEILLCRANAEQTRKESLCTNDLGKNAWEELTALRIPGYRLVGFEYRLSGVGAYRTLFIYYSGD